MNELTTRLGTLYSAVLSDVLDELGVRDRTMRANLVPLGSTTRIAGRAATLQVIAVDSVPAEPYQVQLAAIDALQPGEILVVEAPEVASAFWGELITTRALVRGCVGVIVDGYTRDLSRIRDREFGIWAKGTHPADSLGRLDADQFDVPVRCGDVLVEPGDFVVADEDGVVVIPAESVEDVVTRAEGKAAIEDEVRSRLASGESIVDTYARFGVM